LRFHLSRTDWLVDQARRYRGRDRDLLEVKSSTAPIVGRLIRRLGGHPLVIRALEADPAKAGLRYEKDLFLPDSLTRSE
jgi:hypothetical protein